MSFSEVTGERDYVKYSECKPGDIIAEGWFMNTRPNKFGGGNDYILHKLDGKQIVLNKAGLLRWAIEESGNIEKGDYIRVTFLGKEPLKQGTYKGRDSNQFKVEKDPSRRRPLTGSAPVNASEPAADHNPLMDEF